MTRVGKSDPARLRPPRNTVTDPLDNQAAEAIAATRNRRCFIYIVPRAIHTPLRATHRPRPGAVQ